MQYKSVEELQSGIPRKAVHSYLLEKLQEKLTKNGDSVWITTADNGKKINFSEAEPLSRKIASALIKRGLRKGDSIAMYSNNHVHYLLPVLAAWRCGAIPALVGSECTVDGLIEHVDQPKSKFLFCHTKTAKKALEAAARCPYIEQIFVIDAPHDGCVFLQELYQDDGSDCNDLYEYDFENDIVLLPYSSGTTGRPKAVAHSHRGTVAQFQLMHIFNSKYEMFKKLKYFKGISFHHMSSFYDALGCLGTDNHFVTLEEYSLEAAFQAISTEKPMIFSLHPHTAVALMKYPDISKYDFSSVRLIFSAGAALPKNATEQLKQRLPNLLYVGEGYGSTECGYIASQDPLDPKRKDKLDSIGKPPPNIYVRIIDPDSGDELGPNQDGEIIVRNAYFMKGYYNQPRATAEVLRDDWYYTGDVGHLDEDGYLFLTGRIKEIIKYDVNHISPSLLEGILLRHSDVEDCAVCGIADEDHGYLPKAFVVRKPGVQVTEQELLDFVNEQVADFEKLRGGLVFLDKIPRNQTGKIMRRLLVQ